MKNEFQRLTNLAEHSPEISTVSDISLRLVKFRVIVDPSFTSMTG
jgi:hypothetical protein